MTIAEMHIAINQGLQKIASFQADIFLPQELDLEINKNISRFVKQRYSKISNLKKEGFEESQKRIDDLRTLVTEFSANTVYKGQIGTLHYIDTFELNAPGSSYTGVNSDNYLHLLNIRALVEYNNCKTVSWDVTSTITDILDPQCGCSQLVPGATQALRYANCYAVQPPGVWTCPPINCTCMDGTTEAAVTYQEDINACVGTTTSTGYTWVCDTSTRFVDSNKTTTSSACKFAQHDDIYELLEDPFNTTKHTTPLYTIIGNSIDLYTDDTFVIPKVKITYLRFPATVNILTTVNCDLPLHTHQEIVDMTVNSLLEAISDPRYQTQSVEVLKSE